MKKFLFASALLIALTAAGFRTAPGTLTADERKFAIDYCQKTEARLLAVVEGRFHAMVDLPVHRAHRAFRNPDLAIDPGDRAFTCHTGQTQRGQTHDRGTDRSAHRSFTKMAIAGHDETRRPILR